MFWATRGHWNWGSWMGTLTATYAVFSLCYKFEVRGCLLLGLLLNCLVIDKLFLLSLWDMISISSSNNFTFCITSLIIIHLFLDYFHPIMSTSSEIRNILFGDEERLVRLTELMDFLKIIMEDTEKKVVLAKRDLELQTGAILRIRQLLKESSQNSDDPYHNFLRQCLKKTRDMGTKLEYLMS